MNQIPEPTYRADRRRVHFVAAVAMMALLAPIAARAQRSASGDGEVLTNQTVINMVSAKINKDLLISKINTTPNTFDVTVNGLINLIQGKVSADAMRTMITVAADAKLGRNRASSEVLDNQSVVSMIGSKVPKAVVLAKIQNTKANFDVTSNGLVGLTQAKVPTDVIKAMVAKAGGD